MLTLSAKFCHDLGVARSVTLKYKQGTCKFGIGINRFHESPVMHHKSDLHISPCSIRSGENDFDVFRHLPKGQGPIKLSHLNGSDPWNMGDG